MCGYDTCTHTHSPFLRLNNVNKSPGVEFRFSRYTTPHGHLQRSGEEGGVTRRGERKGGVGVQIGGEAETRQTHTLFNTSNPQKLKVMSSEHTHHIQSNNEDHICSETIAS